MGWDGLVLMVVVVEVVEEVEEEVCAVASS